jgi:hypothetical protein
MAMLLIFFQLREMLVLNEAPYWTESAEPSIIKKE